MGNRAIRRSAAGVALFLGVAAASPARGAISIWDGGAAAADTNWSTGSNWATIFGPQLPPADDGTADILMNASTKLTSTVDTPWSIRSITFNHGPYHINGSSLTIGAGGIVNNEPAEQRFSNNLIVLNDQTWNAAQGALRINGSVDDARFRGADLTITGPFNTSMTDEIGGDLRIIKTGTGTLTYSGIANNSYSRDTFVEGGLLLLSRVGAAVPGNLTIGTDAGPGLGTVRLNANDQIAHATTNVVLIRRFGVLDLAGRNETLHQVDLTGGTITQGGGELNVNGDLRFLSDGGTINTQNGRLWAHANVQLFGSTVATGTNDFIVTGNIDVLASSNPSAISGRFNVNPTPTPVITVADGAAANDLDISAYWYGGGFKKAGPGTMVISGTAANTFSQATNVNEGVLVLNKAPGLTAIPSALTIGDGVGGAEADVVRLAQPNQLGRYRFNDPTFPRSINVQSSGLLDLNGFAESTTHLSFTGGAVRMGAGVLTLYGNIVATVAPTTATIAGTLVTPGTHTFNITDGAQADDLVISATMATMGGVTFTALGQTVIAGASANGERFKVSSGTVVLNKSVADGSAPTGFMLDGTGVVRLRSPEQIGSGAGSIVSIADTAVLDLSGHNETVRDLVMSGGTATTGTGKLTVLGKVTYDAAPANAVMATIAGNLDLGAQPTFAFDVADKAGVNADLDVTAAISNGGVQKNLPGTLRLGGNNTYADGTRLEAGRLLVGRNTALGTGFLITDDSTLEADGNRILANPVTFGGTSIVDGPFDLTLGGSVSIATLQKNGTGILTLSGQQLHNAGALLHATAGGLVMGTNAGSPALANLNLRASGAETFVDLGASQNLASLRVDDGVVTLAPEKVIKTNALTIDATDAKLDLTSGDMIVQATAATKQAKLAEYTALIASARNTPTPWQGFGITTSSAGGITGLGILLNDRGDGAAIMTSFAGQAVNSDSILFKYTYNGDLNLDGRVSIADYLIADRGSARGLSGWANGDVNYSGAVDGADYLLMDQAFLMQGAPLMGGASQIAAPIPEPVVAGLLTPLLLLARRRRG